MASKILNAPSSFVQKPHQGISHEVVSSPTSWRDALNAKAASPTSGTPGETSIPTSYDLLKVLVFKPKTAKTATPVPVIVIAGEETETSAGAIGKKLGLKEMRLAGAELLVEFFGVDKDSLSHFALTPNTFRKVITVVDSTLANASKPLAAHASSSSSTVFLTGTEIVSYLHSLETEETKLQIIDFAELKTSSSSAPAPAGVAGAVADGPAGGASRTAQLDKEKKQDAKIEGAVQIAIGVKKEVDFAEWYTNVLLKSGMLDYYSVSGCYILRPWSFSIWEEIQKWFDARIKEMEVENASFPMFISAKSLEREKDHIEGFSPEVAWVTRAGQSELEEPIAIRPTSETCMYPYYSKWIQSYRDLPLKLNQWNSVVRWEFKNPQPFLRTREYLWQEGHTAHLTKAEADKEVYEILDLYRRVYEELLAVPVIPGVKSEKEKFAGADYTTTVEGFIPTTGRGIQGGTSHSLGQNFSREEMFDISVEDPNHSGAGGAKKLYVWQNSWGLSTRTIGVMVMTHGDNQGLVLPPRVASVQAVVVPCGITAKTNKGEIYDACEKLAKDLRGKGIRAKADLRDGYTPGYKFNDWEQKGVPLRLEIGPIDLQKSQVLTVRRDNGVKAPLPMEGLANSISKLLETIQADMYAKAKANYDERLKLISKWEELVPALDDKNIVVLPWCEREACEDDIKERSGRAAEPQDERAPSAGAKSLCIPIDQKRFGTIASGTKCPACGEAAKRWTMFGRSY